MAEIRADLVGDSRSLEKSIDKVGDALVDVVDSLEDVEREGDATEDALSANMRAIARDAEKTGKTVGRKLDDGFDKAKAGARDFKGEAGETSREVAASFDGSADSIAGGFQELAANAFAGLGPAGVAAGAAAAAGIGVITGAFEKAQEASDEARDSAYEYAQAISTSGAYADAAGRLSELTGSIEALKKITDIATVSGWNQKAVLKALATGDGLPALTKAFDEGANSTNVATGRVLELQGVLDGTKQGLKTGAAAADLQAKALFDLAKKAGTATGEVDDLGNAILVMPDGKEVVIDANTATAYEDIDALEKRKLATKKVPVVADVSQMEWQIRNHKWPTVVLKGEVHTQGVTSRFAV